MTNIIVTLSNSIVGTVDINNESVLGFGMVVVLVTICFILRMLLRDEENKPE